MSVLDLLLGLDPSKIKRPAGKVEIKRLSELAGSTVVFDIQALTIAEEEEIRQIASDGDDVDVAKVRYFTIIKGVTSPNLKDSALLSRFGAASPKELLESGKLLQPGEIIQLYSRISALSGYGDDAIVDVKNA